MAVPRTPSRCPCHRPPSPRQRVAIAVPTRPEPRHPAGGSTTRRAYVPTEIRTSPVRKTSASSPGWSHAPWARRSGRSQSGNSPNATAVADASIPASRSCVSIRSSRAPAAADVFEEQNVPVRWREREGCPQGCHDLRQGPAENGPLASPGLKHSSVAGASSPSGLFSVRHRRNALRSYPSSPRAAGPRASDRENRRCRRRCSGS